MHVLKVETTHRFFILDLVAKKDTPDPCLTHISLNHALICHLDLYVIKQQNNFKVAFLKQFTKFMPE